MILIVVGGVFGFIFSKKFDYLYLVCYYFKGKGNVYEGLYEY